MVSILIRDYQWVVVVVGLAGLSPMSTICAGTESCAGTTNCAAIGYDFVAYIP